MKKFSKAIAALVLAVCIGGGRSAPVELQQQF